MEENNIMIVIAMHCNCDMPFNKMILYHFAMMSDD